MSRTRVLLLAPALVLTVLAGAGSKISRLTDDEYAEYRALRVFLSDDDEKAWLKLKTGDERTQFLKDKGLYDKFWSLPEETRKAIVEGDVQLGWKGEMVYMAWGPPFKKMRLTGRDASRSELLIYRFEIDKNGVAQPLVGSHTDYKAVRQHQTEVTLDDDVVTNLDEKDQWE
jgi:hypothetical protein